MRSTHQPAVPALGRSWNGALAGLMLWAAGPGPAPAQDTATLLARHASLSEQLANNQFHRPFYLESAQNPNDLKGDVYAVINQPFAVAAGALQDKDPWCDLLILHLNVKGCSATGVAPHETLSMYFGRKIEQPLADAYRVDFNFSRTVSGRDYLRVQLVADNGPLSTHDYRIALEAAPLDAQRTFVHLAYSYTYGMAARMAMQGYLSTLGRNKVGFSIVGQDAEGAPIYVDGVRGVVERNTMRYYLAIEAYLGALGSPPADQLEKRLRDWYTASEHYPVQLHELERKEYLEMKHHEVQRQQSLSRAGLPGASAPTQP